MKKQELITQLFDIGAIKFGSFTLKSGIESPIYLDLRIIISFPPLLEAIAETFWQQVKNSSNDLVCGVPYTALPIATVLSINHQIPMVMRRKEVKDYGTRKAIEGVFKPGQHCLIIEDLITSGASVLETIEPLKNEKIQVRDVAVLIDREQGGRQKLEDLGYHVHALLTLSEILQTLVDEKRIEPSVQQSVLHFIKGAQV